MFTWIPIHEETAKRLLEFKNRNHELVDILARMHAAGLKATLINDQGPNGSTFQLKEIDPFSFLANFNRGTKDSNRIAMWQLLKEEWQLESDVPQDFDGLPVANAQNSWLMPYAKERSPEHVTLLWRFFQHILTVEPESLDTALMQQCLDLHKVGLTMLTMGMFWVCPKKWISTDGKNIGYAGTKGITGKPGNAAEYLAWLPKIREAIGGDGVEFSLQAHLWAIGSENRDSFAPPFDRFFPDHQADQVLDYFAKVIELLKDEAENPDELLSMTLRKRSGGMVQMRLNIGMWAVTAIMAKPGQRLIEFLVPFDHPEAFRYRALREAEGQEASKGFADVVDGIQYDLSYLDVTDFFERFDDLWPAIAASARAASRHFSGRRSPFRGNHRLELESLCLDKNQRMEILTKGLPFRVKVSVSDTKLRQYWLIAPGEGAKLWEQWQEQGIAAIGWPKLGDLRDYKSKEEILELLDEQAPDPKNKLIALMLWNIAHEMKIGDIVFAKLGRSELIGWGEVAGEYSYISEEDEYAHVIAVDWRENKAAKLPSDRSFKPKPLTEITGRPGLLAIFAKLYPGIPGLSDTSQDEDDDDVPDLDDVESINNLTPYSIDDALAELFMSRDLLLHILEQLKRKKNIILQGAPGVGKTFIAKRLAWLLLGAKDKSAVEMVQFHQSYTYEDFVQGLRPTENGHFAVKDGCFYRLCRKALANPQQKYFLVIDEINRGNLSKILGELMMLIETDKRGETLTLAYSKDSNDTFTVPPNLYLIGTMNTADRSLSLVDYALRRRFAFLTLDPGFNETTFSAHLSNHGINSAQIRHIIDQMDLLNQEIAKDEVNLGKGYRIGHSFFTPTAPVPDFDKWFQSIVRYEIMPLLEEYWIDDPKMVQKFRHMLTEGIS